MPNHPATPPLSPCSDCGRLMRPQRTAPIPGVDTVRKGAKGLCSNCYSVQRYAEGHRTPAQRRREEQRAEARARAKRRKELEKRLAEAPPVTVAKPATEALPDLLPAADDTVLAWQAEALCAQTDPEVFFPEKGGSTREAKTVCKACPVRQQCLEYALANEERFGVWGGLSERQRRRLTRQMDAA